MTKAEQETIVRWDQDGPEADLYTAHPTQAKRWEKQGYPVEVADRDPGGTPRGWRCRVPKKAIRFRRGEGWHGGKAQDRPWASVLRQ